jgi:hypothetical protein
MLQPLRRSRSTPRYYFAVTGDPFPPDPDGVLLAGPDAARAAALRLMGGILVDTYNRLWRDSGPRCRVTVTDDAGETVCAVTVEGS